MKNFKTIFNFELKQFFGKTSTKVVMAIYFVLAIGITFVPSIMNSNLFKGDSNDNFQRSGYVITDINIDTSNLKDAKKYDSKEQLEKDIKENKLDEGIVLMKDNYEYLSKRSIFSGSGSEFQTAFGKNIEKIVYEQNGLDINKVEQVKASVPQPKLVNVSGDDDSAGQAVNLTIAYVLTFIVYMTVVQFGSIVATNVVKEKSNRAMELLVVTVNPRTLILGKVFALSVGVIIQLGLILGGLFVGMKINLSKYTDNLKFILENLDYKVLAVGVLFSLTGFIMFMFLYAAFASLVSKVEDVNGAVTIPMLIFIAAFFVNYYVMGSSGDTKLAEILSYIPFTSYFAMFTRFAISNVSLTEVAISYGVLFVSTILCAFASVKVYRAATLRYGKKLNFFKLLLGK
ncbi:ABC transporter permease [Gemella cuniculi]|uniref:ABC transporter permease n=1 Tax=Gemella cuniculi TaxID=150240 RepID=UPI0003F862B9|nr:ABC transporter permease [Gemella cuniculi]